MILKIPKSQIFSPYGRYFLAEAPGDDDDPPDVTVDQAPDELDPDMDFNSLDEDNMPIAPDDTGAAVDPDTTTDAPVEAPADDTTTTTDPSAEDDFNALNDVEEDPEPAEGIDNTPSADVQTSNTSGNAETDDTTPDTTSDGTAIGGDDTGDRTEVPVDQADADEPSGDDDFNNMGDDTTADTGDTDTTDTNNDEEKKAEDKSSLDYDSTRKYNLFKEYISLYNAIDNYITKFENIVNDDRMINQVYRIATNSLREIKELTFDYMILKFELSSYVQSLIFYEKLTVAVQLVFRMISDVQKRKKNKSDNETIN